MSLAAGEGRLVTEAKQRSGKAGQWSEERVVSQAMQGDQQHSDGAGGAILPTQHHGLMPPPSFPAVRILSQHYLPATTPAAASAGASHAGGVAAPVAHASVLPAPVVPAPEIPASYPPGPGAPAAAAPPAVTARSVPAPVVAAGEADQRAQALRALLKQQLAAMGKRGGKGEAEAGRRAHDGSGKGCDLQGQVSGEVWAASGVSAGAALGAAPGAAAAAVAGSTAAVGLEAIEAAPAAGPTTMSAVSSGELRRLGRLSWGAAQEGCRHAIMCRKQNWG